MSNHILVNCDTDSIMVAKPDQSPFSEEERTKLLQQLNSLYPPKISWADDGYFARTIIFKTKNYVLRTPEGKLKTKGSAVKAPAKEPAIREFVLETIQAILDNKSNFTEIYTKFVLEALNVQDIKRWATRKTLTAKTYESERANESKIIAAIENTEYVEGNRIWVYFTQEGTLKLAEHYNGDHDPQVLLKKLYMTSKLFDTVLPTKELYLNYSLKRNQKLLETLGTPENIADSVSLAPKLYPNGSKTAEIAQNISERVYSSGNPTCKENLQVPEHSVVISIQNHSVANLSQEPECPGWREIKAKYPELFNKVYNLPNLLPPKEKTFRAFKYFKPKDCKVVIIGQDSYPNKEDACGLAFSVDRGGSAPASLRNIQTELYNDLQIKCSVNNLELWAKQGVLLINSILSTIEGQSLAHKNLGWEQYTDQKIQQILDIGNPLVLMVWGKYAEDKLKRLKLNPNVLVLVGAHPSPLAGGRFFGGKYFSKCNDWLENHGLSKINWQL